MKKEHSFLPGFSFNSPARNAEQQPLMLASSVAIIAIIT